jgi:hypothetical protein
MTLETKIRDRKISYLFRHRQEIALELALLYYILAKRKNACRKVVDTCLKAIYWLKKAKIDIPEQIKQLSPFGLMEEIEKILV